MNYLAIAIPFFLFFILLEYFFSKALQKKVYSFNNTIANLNIGIIERLTDLFTTGLFYFYYDYLYKNFAIIHFVPQWYHWVILLVLTDFLWYWYHRAGHSVNLFWAFHVVHHSSEDYNLTAGVRITFMQAVVRTLFWSLIPIFGFSAPMIISILLIHGAYPFFTHTQLIGKLGWLEYIFVTPSHHRVHHASNDIYLDKNYGDIFIFWDKMFGTFTLETIKPKFGLTKTLKTYDIFWQHFHFLAVLFQQARLANGLYPKLKVFLGRPDSLVIADNNLYNHFESEEYDTKLEFKSKQYIVFQMALVMVILFSVIYFEHYLRMDVKILTSFLLLQTIHICVSIINKSKNLKYLEFLRLIMIAVLFIFVIQTLDPISIF
jgi:alkylglycerol monooxygenase